MRKIFILFTYNLLVIILLSNINPPSIHKIFKKKIPKHLRLRNNDKMKNNIEINTYHSIYDKNIQNKENNKNV